MYRVQLLFCACRCAYPDPVTGAADKDVSQGRTFLHEHLIMLHERVLPMLVMKHPSPSPVTDSG